MEPGGGIPGGLPIGGACCPDPGGGPERTILAIGSLWRERIHFLVSTVSLSLEVEEQTTEAGAGGQHSCACVYTTK